MHLRQKVYALTYLIFCEIKRILFKTKYYAEVDITDNCNLRCKHCYHFWNPFKKMNFKEASLGTWRKRFNHLHKKGVRFILLVGGEPALRQDVIKLAYKTFPAVHIITNGTIEIPKKLGRLILFLSVDGDKEKSDAIRGKGNFNKVIKNYSGDHRTIINITLLKENYTDLESIVKTSIKHNLRGVVCNLYMTSPDYDDPLYINRKDRSRIIQEIKRVKKLYPSHLLLTKSIINWYAEPDHRGYCFWGDEVYHYDSSWKRRRCFSGPGCANCGCFAGSFQNPLSLLRYLREAFKLI